MQRKRTRRHEELKGKERGKPEKKLPGGKRIDVGTEKSVTEIERSGDPKRIKYAIRKLKSAKQSRKTLRVPQKDMPLAEQLAREEDAPITLTNLSKTKRRRIKPK